MASSSQTGAPASARALVEAAKRLLAAHAPSAITGRELAETAGVNYGLVHRHFGSKTAVLDSALDELQAEFLTDGFDDDGLPIPLALAERRGLWRAIVHAHLDRADFGARREGAPITGRCLAGVSAARRELSRRESMAVVALALSIEFGLPTHRDVLAGAVALSPADPAIDALVRQWLDGLYRGHGPLGGAPGVRSNSSNGRKPRRPDSAPRTVENRLVEAGADLLTDRAPSAISGRQLAQAAGVNYGLIHHYFGTKDEVLRRSLQLHRDRFFHERSTSDSSPRFFSITDHPGYVRAATWHALDPRLVDDSLRFPVADQMLERLTGSATGDDVDVAVRVAVLTAISSQLAWALFSPAMKAAFGVDPRALEPAAASLLRVLLLDPMRDARAPASTLGA